MPDEAENLILHQLRLIRSDMHDMRKDLTNQMADVRGLCLATFDKVKRLERRIEEVRDDMETTIKAEIMGVGLDWRRRLEDRIEAVEERHSPSP